MLLHDVLASDTKLYQVIDRRCCYWCGARPSAVGVRPRG